MKDLVKKENLENEFYIESSATCRAHIGEEPHFGTRKKLKENNISCKGKTARKMEKSDYDRFDYIIAMDESNIDRILYIIGEDNENKVSRLLEFACEKRDVKDPWITGNFDETYDDVLLGCKALLQKIK